MNLQPLFETQKKLDERIVKEKGLEGVDLLDKKILALQVELGELANEWQMFKFWKDNPKPRYETAEIYVHGYDGPGTDTRASIEEYQAQPILEEYVDCLHFILSIANTINTDYFVYDVDIQEYERKESITKQFQAVFGYAFLITEDNYCSELLNTFLDLGTMLGFTWEQIEQAYYDKNKVNHERQSNGY